jgi:rod shape determining protein RodA
MSLRERWHIDWPLLTGILLLLGVSLVVLYSAGGQNLGVLARQSLRIVMALVVMLAVAQVSPPALLRWSPYLYGVGLVLLVVVLGVGVIGKGAQRWLDLGIFRFQPAEIMKLAVPMMVAHLLSRHPLPPKLRYLALAGLLVALPAFLVIKQPDLGTAILIAAAGLLVIFLAGISWRLIFVLAAGMAAAAPLVWSHLHDYQRQRILTLFNPWSDPLGSGYHTIQSTIAVGSGGFFGKGWLNGSQSQLEFIPERATDFIFAVLAEEFGLLGVLLLLALYFFIIGRCLWIATYAKDTFSRLLAGSLALTFFFYVFVNMGMVTGILPVVGVPLPLVSYGGTSMVTLMAGFGMLMGIHTHRRLVSH